MLEKLIVFVEEPSMEAALEHLLPKMRSGVAPGKRWSGN